MKIIRGKDINFIPVAHEDPENPGVLKKVLFKKEELSSGRVQMINWVKLLSGRTMRPHAHENMEEIFVIVSGRAIFNQEILEEGDAVLVNRGETHEMKALGEKEVHYLVIGIV